MAVIRSLTVKQLNMYVRSLLESDANLRKVTVSGEISNYTRNARSGHAYFSLKDSDAAVRVVMFSSYADKVTFKPEDGMKVLVTGTVNLYEKDGQYQINAYSMTEDGVGQSYIEFLRLKEKLMQEGLFDDTCKRPLPLLPKEIGVISSSTGAALQDIISVSTRRFPNVNLSVFPASVQGEECAPSVIRGIRFFNEKHPVDVIIIARGGGSYEDLSGFNDEDLARAVYGSQIPVVSAVGHEVDFTILDFVADLRAPTPSAAAEIVVPLFDDLLQNLDTLTDTCYDAMSDRINREEDRLKGVSYRLNLSNTVEKKLLGLTLLFNRSKTAYERIIERRESELANVSEKIQALSPMATLMRGFSIVTKNKSPITSVKQIIKNDELSIRVKDGEINCVAKEIHEI